MTISSTSPSTEACADLDPTRVVDNRVYYDLAVYRAEMERIFARSWQLVCHESEVAQVGDYFTASLAESPVIVVRGKDERVRAFYNTCRHRGSKIAMDPCGHAAALRCAYHFWTYSLEGDLVGIPGEEAYDGTGFDKANFPMIPLRCEVIFGLVFVNPDRDCMSLEDWLGKDVLDTLEAPLGRATFEVAKKRTSEMPVNWKIWAENARDGYHVPFVHPFFRKASPPGDYKLCPNGHAIQRLGMSEKGMEPELWAAVQADVLPGVEPTDGYIVTLFPDTTVMVRSNFVSLDVQHYQGVKQLVFEERLLTIKGDSPETRSRRALGQEAFLWDRLEQEDHPIFLAQQAGVETRGVRYSVIARGVDAMVGQRGDDNRLRHFWTQWRAMMGVERNAFGDGDS